MVRTAQLKVLSLISATLIAISLIWFFLTVTPVLMVEAKYQYKKTLTTVFQVEQLKDLILPSFAFLDTRGESQYKEYGIYIPAIYLDEKVVFNVNPNEEAEYAQALQQGIAHASGTAFPDNPGIGYYFAHSSSPELASQLNAVFYLLGKLRSGDEVFIWHEGKRFEYRVSHSKITQPDDVSFLKAVYPHETIVLQTCWPPGTTNERLLVFAERRL
jgi:LPXTG-site transpeptidase (sortase) family protein